MRGKKPQNGHVRTECQAQRRRSQPVVQQRLTKSASERRTSFTFRDGGKGCEQCQRMDRGGGRKEEVQAFERRGPPIASEGEDAPSRLQLLLRSVEKGKVSDEYAQLQRGRQKEGIDKGGEGDPKKKKGKKLIRRTVITTAKQVHTKTEKDDYTDD